MKLRFRGNSLRLRVNQKEVQQLAAGEELREELLFDDGAKLAYTLASSTFSKARFDGGEIRVTAALAAWAKSDDIGYHFGAAPGLKVLIERDLECVDGPEDERDPHAFPRSKKTC